jgi:hypothetical protein
MFLHEKGNTMAASRKPRKAVAGKRDPFAGLEQIPEDDRWIVKALYATRLVAGKKVTPQGVYAELLQGRKQEEEAAAEEKKKRQAEWAAQRQEDAKEDVEHCLQRLAECRDMLRRIEDNPSGYGGERGEIEHDTLARLIRLDIKETGTKLEQALCDLGVIPENEHGAWFNLEELKSQMPKAEKAEARP